MNIKKLIILILLVCFSSAILSLLPLKLLVSLLVLNILCLGIGLYYGKKILYKIKNKIKVYLNEKIF
jgi:VIT1/CCC1 family predicted Fe2+/Mn2+ transporter